LIFLEKEKQNFISACGPSFSPSGLAGPTTRTSPLSPTQLTRPAHSPFSSLFLLRSGPTGPANGHGRLRLATVISGEAAPTNGGILGKTTTTKAFPSPTRTHPRGLLGVLRFGTSLLVAMAAKQSRACRRRRAPAKPTAKRPIQLSKQHQRLTTKTKC
jgi:hypothetical protein